MIYLELLLGFLRVGFFSFGGAYAAIPIIRDIVILYGWMTDEELTYIIAISESTPGPLMVNLATYIGATKAGMLGAFIATISVVIPAFIIILLVMVVFNKLLDNKHFQAILNGLKPCIAGIILATGVYIMLNTVMFSTGAFSLDIRALIIAIFLLVIMFGMNYGLKKRLSPIMLLVISAISGMVIYGI